MRDINNQPLTWSIIKESTWKQAKGTWKKTIHFFIISNNENSHAVDTQLCLTK